MDEYNFIVQDSIENFERNLRAAVGTGDQMADRLFLLEPRTPDAPDVLSVVMVQQYPDEMTPSPPGFDWGQSPRQRVVHGVLLCHVSPYGASGIEVIMTCVDDDASAYGKLLAQKIDKRYPGSWQRPAEVEQVREDKAVKQPIGQAHAKGRVSDEIKERANRARLLHVEHPEWSTQSVADHLMDTLTDAELSKLKRGFNRQSCLLMGEDIENAWYRMAEVEGSEKWPKWSTGKNPLR